jgi:hypothetical protein
MLSLFILDVKSSKEREKERIKQTEAPLVIIVPMIWLLFYSYKVVGTYLFSCQSHSGSKLKPKTKIIIIIIIIIFIFKFKKKLSYNNLTLIPSLLPSGQSPSK